MSAGEKSKPGRLERRREKKREKQLRTGDSQEKVAERARKGGPPPEEVSALEALGSPRNMWQRNVGRKPPDYR